MGKQAQRSEGACRSSPSSGSVWGSGLRPRACLKCCCFHLFVDDTRPRLTMPVLQTDRPMTNTTLEPSSPWRTPNCSSVEQELTLPDLPYRAAARTTAAGDLGSAVGGVTRFRNVPEPGALEWGWGRGSYVARKRPSLRPQRGQNHYREGTSSRQRQIGLIDPN